MEYYCFSIPGKPTKPKKPTKEDLEDGFEPEVEPPEGEHVHVTGEQGAIEYAESNRWIVIQAETDEQAENILELVKNGKAKPVKTWVRRGKIYGEKE